MISSTLKNDIDHYVEELRATSSLLARAKAGTLPAAAIGKYFSSIHYLLTQTPIHLELAEKRARELGAHDLARYFATKRIEEDDHHKWAESDLEQLGEIFGAEVRHSCPATAMVELVKQTRAAISEDPYAFLAYILFAEYFTVAIGPEWLSALQTRCGVPAAAMTSVSNHVELDKHHVIDGCREIDSIVTDEGRGSSLRALLSATIVRFSSFCEELAAA
jgi:hypothetical protein